MLHFQSRHYIVGDSEKSPLFYITVLASAQIFEHCGSAAYAVVALDICAEDMSFSIWKKNDMELRKLQEWEIIFFG